MHAPIPIGSTHADCKSVCYNFHADGDLTASVSRSENSNPGMFVYRAGGKCTYCYEDNQDEWLSVESVALDC